MADKRYPQGSPTEKIPDIKIVIDPETPIEDMHAARRRQYMYPSSVGISDTSNARKCFVERHYSSKLQKCLLNYSIYIVKSIVLSGEI